MPEPIRSLAAPWMIGAPLGDGLWQRRRQAHGPHRALNSPTSLIAPLRLLPRRNERALPHQPAAPLSIRLSGRGG
ncbi:MAG: hypothetical protein ACRD0K_00785 [Egibacteraceae bacterium]